MPEDEWEKLYTKWGRLKQESALPEELDQLGDEYYASEEEYEEGYEQQQIAPPTIKPLPEPQVETPHASKNDLDQITLKIEKIEGKIEMINEYKKNVDDKISRLSEQLGELRSMIMERERALMNIDTTYEKIKSLFEEVQPIKIQKDLEKKEREIVEVQSRADRLESLTREMVEEIKDFRKMLGSIKNVENLVSLLDKIDNKIQEVEAAKTYTDRVSGKVERIFSELSERLVNFDKNINRIENTEKLASELAKSVDSLEIKIETLKKLSEPQK